MLQAYYKIWKFIRNYCQFITKMRTFIAKYCIRDRGISFEIGGGGGGEPLVTPYWGGGKQYIFSY